MPVPEPSDLLGAVPASGLPAVSLPEPSVLLGGFAVLGLLGLPLSEFTKLPEEFPVSERLGPSGFLRGPAALPFLRGTASIPLKLSGLLSTPPSKASELLGAAPASGLPAVSLPGPSVLLGAAPASGLPAVSLPGPSVLLGAVPASGLPAVSLPEPSVLLGAAPASGLPAIPVPEPSDLLGGFAVLGLLGLPLSEFTKLPEEFPVSERLGPSGFLRGPAALPFLRGTASIPSKLSGLLSIPPSKASELLGAVLVLCPLDPPPWEFAKPPEGFPAPGRGAAREVLGLADAAVTCPAYMPSAPTALSVTASAPPTERLPTLPDALETLMTSICSCSNPSASA